MRTLPITRSADIVTRVSVANEEQLVSAINLLDGVDSIAQIKALLKDRFGTRIIYETDSDGNRTPKVVKGATADGIDLDRYETIYTGTFRRLVKVKAACFTGSDQTWTISLPGEEEAQAADEAPELPDAIATKAPTPALPGAEKPEDAPVSVAPIAQPVAPEPVKDEKSEALTQAETVYEDYRTAGKARLNLIRCDRLSVACKISYMRLLWRSGRLVYEPVYPNNLFFAFPRTVTERDEDGKEYERASVTTEIEDACAVVIRAAESRTSNEVDGDNSNTGTFVAYLGRSDAYPEGRHLVWQGERWDNIPLPGDESIIEEDPAGNPLTRFGNANPEYDAIEYPIIPFYGTDAGAADSLLPTQSIDLPLTMLEIETTACRILTALSDAARGAWVFTKGANTTDLAAPFGSMTSTMIMLETDQDARHESLGAQEALTALDGLGQLLRMVAENHDVPGYQVTPDDSAAPESGIKLAIETKPQTDDRAERAEQTHSSIERLWLVEKAFINMFAPADRRIPLDAVLSWDPGTVEIPESETERVTNIKACEDAGYIDHIEAVRKFHRLGSRAEAEDMIESMGNPKAASKSAGGFGGFGLGQDL